MRHRKSDQGQLSRGRVVDKIMRKRCLAGDGSGGGISAVSARVVVWTEGQTAFDSGFYTSAVTVASRRTLGCSSRSPSFSLMLAYDSLFWMSKRLELSTARKLACRIDP